MVFGQKLIPYESAYQEEQTSLATVTRQYNYISAIYIVVTCCMDCGKLTTPSWLYRLLEVPYTVYCVMIPFGTAGALQDTSTTDVEARRTITSLGGVGAGGKGGGIERKHTHTKG